MAPRIRPLALDSSRYQEIKRLLEPIGTADTLDPDAVAALLAPLRPLSADDMRLAGRWLAKCMAANFLRKARERNGWSQRELAGRLGLKSGYVPQSESTRSESKVPLDYLVQVACIAGVPLHMGAAGNAEKLKLRVQQLERKVSDLEERLAEEQALSQGLFEKLRR